MAPAARPLFSPLEPLTHVSGTRAVGVALSLGVVVLGVVAYFSYKWLLARFQPATEPQTDTPTEPPHSAPPPSIPTPKPSLTISHSLPDISDGTTSSRKQAPPRQTTLPTVPSRLQTFQRQLSHRLDLSDVPFEVCQFAGPGLAVGAIRPELYGPPPARRPEEEEDAASCCGRLRFSLRYDPDVEGLVVRTIQAHDLPAKDFSGGSDPYVKIYLLPDRKKKFQTRVHRKNLNPVFNETFVFGLSQDQLKSRTLQFSVYDFDRFSRHDLIGHVIVRGLGDLCDVSRDVEFVMDIVGATQEKKDLGELLLSLCYLPTAGRLTVTVVKARSLKAMDITGSSDPYVKVSLICHSKRIKKKKTSVKKSTLHPVYNEALVYDVPAENIEDVDLAVKVIDYDMVGANEMMGCCAIGNSCVGPGRDHWLEMLENPRKPVAQWYSLVDSLPPTLDRKSSPVRCLSMR